MRSVDVSLESPQHRGGFTLVEMMIVIVIMSVLMTAGAIGLGGIGGKGVSTGVAAAESMFSEARNIAVSKKTNARVLIAQSVANPEDNLRRILVAYEEVDKAGKIVPGSWILASRGVVLPEQTFFSETFSRTDHAAGTGAIPVMDSSSFKTLSSGLAATYFYYEFNSEGISPPVTTVGAGAPIPGKSFVIGAGARSQAGVAQPRVTAQGKKDFGGFVIWGNGRTSAFRSPSQISSEINSLTTGAPF